MVHKPVLVKEVVMYLCVEKGGTYIDATMDGGGHTLEILKRVGPAGRVLGIEHDKELAESMEKRHISNLIVEQSNYTAMEKLARRHGLNKINGVLFDLGMSSWHIESSSRGFSFLKDEPLDMRYSMSSEITAAHIVNSETENRLAEIFHEYGEERYSRRIAKEIVKKRKSSRIISTRQLVDIILSAMPPNRKYRIHPATRVFQALRIAVNNELYNVQEGLKEAMGLVASGGRVVVISFHSLEDRIAKNLFREAEGIVLTAKPVRAALSEIKTNARSRSAVLRAWEKI